MYITLAEGAINRGYIGSFYGNAEDVDFGTYSTNFTGKLHLVTGSVPRLTVTAAGNIGIGTSTPAQKLEVLGGIKIGNTTTNVEGSIRYNNSRFEGHTTNNWVSFDQLPIGTLVASRFFPNFDLEDQGYIFRGVINDIGIMEVQQGVAADSWLPTSLKNLVQPEGSAPRPAVYTGTEELIWGGVFVGYRYDPARNTWSLITTANEPVRRTLHTAVWTGTEMIIWGGLRNSTGIYLNTGGRYNPVGDSWTATTTTNAPTSRNGHTAIWTGTEMIIWGGIDGGVPVNTGARYNPATNTWTTMTTSNAPVGRENHTVVWTGTQMIIWGGVDVNGSLLNSGAKYNPATNTWTTISLAGAPSARRGHTAYWTGTTMLIWGGYGGGITGASYNSMTNTWPQTTSLANAPAADIEKYAAVWTGTDMIIWGGLINAGNDVTNTGKKYNPGNNTWTTITTTGAPSPRYSPMAFWTGREMVIFSGADYQSGFQNTGGRYFPDAQPSFQAFYENPGACYLYSKQ